MKKRAYWAVFLLSFCWATTGWTAQPSFDEWKQSFYQTALANGVSRQTLDKYMQNINFLEQVIELDRKQPEFSLSFYNYINRTVSPARIQKGREMLQKNRAFLSTIEEKYGIPPSYLVAFWGLETNFGTTKGNIDTLSALATLSFDKRRSAFFTKELLSLLKTLQKEAIEPPKGSWAGAFGHYQFMPTTFENYAIDGDNDGQKDIYHSWADSTASAANYLSRMGWKKHWRWGREVRINQQLPTDISLNEKRPIADWKKWGVDPVEKKEWQDDELTSEARLILPAGIKGPAFLVYDNFDVIKRWNNSDFYALAVGILSDKISQIPTSNVETFPKNGNISTDEIKQFQTVLKEQGFYNGKIDGINGSRLKEAVILYQKKQGIFPDGFLSKEILEKK